MNEKLLPLFILFLGKLLLLSCDIKLRELRESREAVNIHREAARLFFPAAWFFFLALGGFLAALMR